MRDDDLTGLYFDASDNLSDPAAGALLDRGVDACPSEYRPGVLKVRNHGRFWEPDLIDGKPHYVVPEWIGHEVIDLVAFKLSTPEKFRALTGATCVLGHRNLETDAPLLVCRDPLTWLRHGCQGIVPLDAEAWPLVRGFDYLDIQPKIWAPTVMRALERTRPRLPKLRVAA